MCKFFKIIPGYEDYLVSENGDVFSKKSNKLLKSRKNKKGYLYVVLCTNGKPKTLKIHRLVAMTFLNNPNNYPVINHKDGNKLNNHISNLEFCTVAYNNKHAWDNGLRENARETTRQLGKLNCKRAQEARVKHLDENLKELFDEIFIRKSKTKDISKKYNISCPYVSMIKSKRVLKTAISEYEKSNLFDVWNLYFNNK